MTPTLGESATHFKNCQATPHDADDDYEGVLAGAATLTQQRALL